MQFNKGSLYNVAYIESQKFGEWHCLVFHDVDLLLQDSRNLYTCSKSPIHLSPSVESQNYKYLHICNSHTYTLHCKKGVYILHASTEAL